MGCYAGNFSGLRAHWNKCRKLKKPLEVACVIGVPPNLSYAAVARIAPELSEFAVAGGISGEPVELVRCKTVDLLIPAQAEIVVEGTIPTDQGEWEGPFGEFPGYMAHEGQGFFVNVNCITTRKNPVYIAFLSQFPPSESSKIRGVAAVGPTEIVKRRSSHYKESISKSASAPRKTERDWTNTSPAKHSRRRREETTILLSPLVFGNDPGAIIATTCFHPNGLP
jgi:UbiD family decarboxylase